MTQLLFNYISNIIFLVFIKISEFVDLYDIDFLNKIEYFSELLRIKYDILSIYIKKQKIYLISIFAITYHKTILIFFQTF